MALFDSISRLSALSGSFFFWESARLVSAPFPSYSSYWEQEDSISADCLHFSDLSDSCGLAGFQKLRSPEEAAKLLSERKLWKKASLLFIPDLCQSGDYGGSTYALSNKRALLEEFGGFQCRELLGGYGSEALAVDPRFCSEDFLEALESLEAYPVWDEEKLSELEEELKEEAFSSWLERDLRGKLEDLFQEAGLSEEESEQRAEALTEDQLWDILRISDSCGTLWIPEHNTMFCDLDRVTLSSVEEAGLLESCYAA